MSSIYYPYFMLENITHERYGDHKQRIVLLSLFADRILIPCRHFFLMERDEFDDLIYFLKEYISEGIVYYRLPEDKCNLETYAKGIGRGYRDFQYRLQALKNIDVPDKCAPQNVYSVDVQQTYFSDRIKSFIRKIIIPQISNDAEKRVLRDIVDCPQKITRESLMQRINGWSIQNDTREQIIHFSDVLYFLAGASRDKLRICHDAYFDISNFDMSKVIQNYTELICKNYEPPVILERLKELGFSIDNIEKLSFKDVKKLRSLIGFKKFSKQFCTSAKYNDGLKFLIDSSRFIKLLPRIINVTVSFIVSATGFIITNTCDLSKSQNIIISIVLFIVPFLLLSILQKKSTKINILNFVIPKTFFLFKMKQFLNDKTIEA